MTIGQDPIDHTVGIGKSSRGPVRSVAFFLQQKHLGLFFKPVQLHLELSDLAIEFCLQFFAVLLGAFASIRKELRQLVQKLLPPLADLVGVNAVLCGDLGHGLLSPNRLQGHSRLEGGVVTPAHVSCHAAPPSNIGRLTCTLLPCPVSGESYSDQVFVPVIKPPFDLFEVEMEVLPGHPTVWVEPGLGIGPEAFDAVEMVPALGSALVFRDGHVIASHSERSIRMPVIRVIEAARLGMLGH